MGIWRTAAAGLGLLLPGFGAAVAGAPVPAGAQVADAATAEEMFEEADANDDGVLDREEWALLGDRTSRWEEVFGATPGERTRFQGTPTLLGDAEAFHAADDSDDGVVSWEEFLEYARPGGARRGR